MVKRANQILSRTQVNPGLTTNRGIHLSQHSGGDLHQVDATHVERCQQTSYVAHHAASESNDDRAPIGAQVTQLLR